MQLSDMEYQLLTILNNQQQGRSDALARAMAVSNPAVMAKVGLSLRASKFVSSTNDGQPYNLWAITPAGKAAYLEERNRRAVPKPVKASPVVVPVNTRHWVIDHATEQANGPFSCRSAARKEAEVAARENPGTEYIIVSEVETVVAELTVKVKP